MGTSATSAGRLRGRDADASRRGLSERVERRVPVTVLIAHMVGIVDVVALALFALPDPEGGTGVRDHLVPNVIACAVYIPVAALLGFWYGRRLGLARTAWLTEGREPDAEERARVLAIPARIFKMDAALWAGAAVLLFAVNVPVSPALAGHVAATALLGGVTTCAIAHLALERQLRPVTELALAAGPPARRAWPGVEGRLVLAWLLATGSPLLGVIIVGLDATTREVPAHDVAVSAVVLGGVAFVVGLGVTLVAARSVSAPLTAVRRALGRVQAGDLAAEVRVDDGSEVGLLQSGFNAMVAGLRERERMQELYARQVGEEVAAAALADEPRLGGQVQEIAVLFVDMVGSTALAADLPPERVVARLNRFFAVIVEVVAEHGGWVNKFEGDAALCVFGAPASQVDAAGCALAAGRALRDRLARDVPGSDAGIGLSAGPAVAGWVGAEQRFEYTVIGDPVNVAARLCELAKTRPERLLAAEAIIARAASEEAARWTVGERVTLRGRAQPTAIAVPR